MSISVLIVDDHKVVRQGLEMFLALDAEIEIVGEAAGGEEAVALSAELNPDIILMDLLMPGMDGIEATRAIKLAQPEVEIIALTSILEDDKVVGAVRAGAIGYLLKDTEPDELCRAIRAAASGQIQLSPAAAQRLVREVRAPDSPETLTERETEVLRLVAEGLSNRQIALQLSLSEKTVKTHVSNILGKLNLLTRTQAALFAVRAGLVDNSATGHQS
jgi:NarL family two-component system response regulator LiaR